MAHTQEAAEEIFRIVHRFVDWLPRSCARARCRTSRANVRQIVFPEMDSQYRVVSAGDRNAGRGLTVQNLHCSELARWPGDPAETLAGLRAALTPDAELILESTPDGVGGCFYEEWQKAPETGMVRHFFPWWMERRYRAKAVDAASLTEEERDADRAHISDSGTDRIPAADPGQLSRPGTAGVRRGRRRAAFWPAASRSLSWPRSSRGWHRRRQPAEWRRNGELEIWLPPVPRQSSIWWRSIRPAAAARATTPRPRCWRWRAGLQCAEFAGHVGGLELARLVSGLRREYNHAWLVVERNNHGSGVLALAREPCADYPRIYRQAGQPGWLTTSVSRPAALGRLGAALVEQPERFKSRRLLAECSSFVRLPNGSTGARAGNARRPGDGHGDRAGRAGGAAGKRSR